MSTLPAKIKEEFLALLPPTIFFFIALHIGKDKVLRLFFGPLSATQP